MTKAKFPNSKVEMTLKQDIEQATNTSEVNEKLKEIPWCYAYRWLWPLLHYTGLHRSVAIFIGLLFTLRHCNPVCAPGQKSLRFVGGMKSNPVCAVLGNAKCNPVRSVQ